MKIACNECRQRLSDILDETANREAHSALTEHLAACDSCRAELKMLQATRDELRSFPTLSAPVDLRSRVRSALEAEVVSAPDAASRAEASGVKTKDGIAPAIIVPATIKTVHAATPHNDWSVKEPTRWETWRDNLRAFLRNPTSITWASCCVLLLFYFVSLSRRPEPSGIYDDVTRAPLGEPYEKRYNGDEEEVTPAYVSPHGPVFDYEPYSGVPPKAEPGSAPKWPQPNLPQNALPVPAANSSGQKPNTKPDSPRPQNGGSAGQSKQKPQAPPRSNLPEPAPGAKAKKDSDVSPSSNEAPRTAARARDDNRETAPAPSAAKAPVTQSSQDNYLARSDADGARGPAGAASAKADRAQGSDDSPKSSATREITTRLTPPRSVGWSQISVVLSGGARFADGTKSRVIWRGAAQANESIDLSFSVQNAVAGNAKITLQEVKGGQAQTIAYKNVAIAAAR